MFEASGEDHFAAGLDDVAGGAQSHSVKLLIPHSMTVAFHVADARLSVFASVGVLTKRGEQLLQSFVVQFLFPLAGPLFRFWAAFPVDDVGDLVEVL